MINPNSTPAHAPEQNIFERVEKKINKDPVYQLLLEFQKKYPKEILVSGNLPDLVNNLRSAVDAGRIPLSRVFALLQEYEENGNQSILYYKPMTAAVKNLCCKPSEVGQLLFGPEWLTTQGFPKLPRLNSGYEVVDFRIGISGKPNDWLLKIYTFQESRVSIRELDRADLLRINELANENEFAILYENRITESVCTARWNDHERHGLLELRVESGGRRDRFAMDVNALWSQLQKAFEWKDFQAWEMGIPLEQMLRECETNPDIYQLGAAKLVDSGEGGVRFTPYTEKDPLDAAPVRMTAIRQVLDDGGRCSGLVATWLPKGSNGHLDDKLRTYAGSLQTNQLVISAQATARAVDYVTDQLRYFAG